MTYSACQVPCFYIKGTKHWIHSTSQSNTSNPTLECSFFRKTIKNIHPYNHQQDFTARFYDKTILNKVWKLTYKNYQKEEREKKGKEHNRPQCKHYTFVPTSCERPFCRWKRRNWRRTKGGCKKIKRRERERQGQNGENESKRERFRNGEGSILIRVRVNDYLYWAIRTSTNAEFANFGILQSGRFCTNSRS